jgi:hypothetical protein
VFEVVLVVLELVLMVVWCGGSIGDACRGADECGCGVDAANEGGTVCGDNGRQQVPESLPRAVGYVLDYFSADYMQGRAIAQAVSRWLSTAEARVRSQVRSCGICGGQSVTEAGFLQVLRVSLANPHSTDCSIIIIIDHPGLVQ